MDVDSSSLMQSQPFSPFSSFELEASASSGLPVSFESHDHLIATIEGNTVTVNGAGDVFITAVQSRNENYLSAPPVQQLLHVEIITALQEEKPKSFSFYPNPTNANLMKLEKYHAHGMANYPPEIVHCSQ